MSDKSVSIPEYIDTYPQFLFLEVDDLIPFIGGMMIGVILRYLVQSAWGFTLGLLIGALMSYVYIRFKRNTLPGTLLHYLYHITGLIKLNRHFQNGLLRRVKN